MSCCCYRLQIGEPAGADFRRIVEEQIDEAIAQLQRARASRRKRVHEARKAIKKTRSALRLIHPAISTEAYDAATAVLREVAQTLAPLRDADVLRDTAAALLHKSKPNARRSPTAKTSLPPLAEPLVELKASLQAWPWTEVAAATVAQAFAQTVRRFSKAFHTATAANEKQDDELFHDWRKRAKDLRYQCLLLEPLWPALFKAYADSAEKLEDQLGQDHDLAVLRQHHPSLAAEASQRQQHLRHSAQKLGKRLSAEDPKAWKKRIAAWFHL